MTIHIREIEPWEIPLLDDLLYDAIFIPEGQERPSIEIIQLPTLSRYVKDFGKESDLCLVAELQGKLIGAIWTRVFSETEKGFGYVDSATPELSMSVREEYRQQGIGRKLMEDMLSKLKGLGYRQVSLSVDKLNFASLWYPKFGFEEVVGDEHSVVMVKRL